MCGLGRDDTPVEPMEAEDHLGCSKGLGEDGEAERVLRIKSRVK